MKRFVFFLPVLLQLSCFARQFHVIHFSQKNGMPQNSVNGLFWDHQNMLWVSTEDGMVSYDGNKLRNLNDSGGSDFHKNRFRWIVPSDRQSGFAAGANGYVYEINRTGIRSVLKGSYHFIGADYLSKEELLWLYDRGSYARMKKDGWRQYPVQLVHSGKRLWVLGVRKLLKYEAQKLKDSIDIPLGSHHLFTIGKRIFIVAKKQLYELDEESGRLTKVRTNQALRTTAGVDWFVSSLSGPVILLNNDSMLRVVDRRGEICFDYITRLSGLVQGKVSKIVYNSRLKQYAIGTGSNGLYLLKPDFFHTVSDQSGSAFNVHVAFNDSIVIGTDGGAYGLNGRQTRPEYNFLNINRNILLIDANKTVWSAKNDSLLVQCIDRPRRSLYTGERYRVKAFKQKEDTIIVVTLTALLRFVSVNGFPHCVDTLLTSIPLCEKESPVSVCWYHNDLALGSEKGVFMININTGKVEQLSAINNVWMLASRKGQLMGSSFNNGLFVIRNNTTIKLPPDPHLFLQKAHHIYETPDGSVFVSTNKGLLKTQSNWIKDYLDGKSGTIPWEYYTDAEGIENPEFNGGCDPGVVALRNGMVSFANMGGLVWFDVQPFLGTQVPSPKLYLSTLEIDNRSLAISDTIEIQASEENITIEPGCIYWGNPLDIRLMYRLEGYMSIPQYTDGQKIQFTQLPAGTYKLLLECSAGAGADHTDSISILVIKHPKFYETTAFYILVCCGLIAFVVICVVLNDRRLTQQNRILEKKVTLRTQELQESNTTLQRTQEELHQSIRVKNKLISIIAHDIVTPLKFISLVAKNFKTTMERNSPGKEVIEEIHHTSQRLFDNAQNILEWIRYQNNLIRVRRTPIAPYVIGEEITELFADMVLLKQNAISNQVEMEDMITTDPIILKIILQNLVANAVKHTRDAEIVLSSERLEQKYILSVSDTGQGLSEAGLRRIEALRNHLNRNIIPDDSAEGSGLGYIIIFELSVLINAQIELDNVPDKGLTVRVILPLNER